MNMLMLVHIGLLYFIKTNETVYFDRYGVDCILEDIKEFTGSKNIITNIFRVQASNAIMCEYFNNALDSLILCSQVKL